MANGERRKFLMSALTWSQDGASVVGARRLDPEYFDPRCISVAAELEDRGARPLREFVLGAWRGISPEYDQNGNIRVVKTANIQRFELSALPDDRVAENDAVLNAIIPPGSLLITSTGVGSAGRCFAYFGDERIVGDGHITVLPLRCEKEDGAFLCAYLQSAAGRQQIIRLHRGSSRQIEIYPEDILSVPVLWPSRDVRQNIGEQWLSAVEAVESSRACVRTAVTAIENYIGTSQSEVDDIAEASWEVRSGIFSVGRRLDPEYGAPRVETLRRAISQVNSIPLSRLIENVWKGVQPDGYDPDGSVVVVKTKDVGYPEFSLARCERTYGSYVNQLRPGQVLINMTGEGTIGRSAVVPYFEEDRSVVAAVDVATVDVDKGRVLPEYVALFLNSWMGRHQTRALQTGSSGQQHIYPAHFSEILIPVQVSSSGNMNLDWQRQIVMQAEQRSDASRKANEVGETLDGLFSVDLGVQVDLATIPY